jgi:hypothetical protein
MSSVTVGTGICVAKADPMRQRIERFFPDKIEGVKKRTGVAANSTLR